MLCRSLLNTVVKILALSRETTVIPANLITGLFFFRSWEALQSPNYFGYGQWTHLVVQIPHLPQGSPGPDSDLFTGTQASEPWGERPSYKHRLSWSFPQSTWVGKGRSGNAGATLHSCWLQRALTLWVSTFSKWGWSREGVEHRW